MKTVFIALSLLSGALLVGCNGEEPVSEKDSIDTKGLVDKPYEGKSSSKVADTKAAPKTNP